MLARLWARWKTFAQKIGDFQARVILTLLYFVIFGPMALVVRVLKDPLRIKHAPQASVWLPKPAEDTSVEVARRQF